MILDKFVEIANLFEIYSSLLSEKQKEYLFLGESNISWYVYQYKNQCYMELDQPSGREIHRFRNFYEMCDKVLSEAIMG